MFLPTGLIYDQTSRSSMFLGTTLRQQQHQKRSTTESSKIVSGLEESGTKTVFIAEIMTRGDFSKSPDSILNKTTFDNKRQKINYRLAKTYKDHLIRFPDMRYPRDYHTDLVHLLQDSSSTNNTGMNKYESRIRRLLCSLRS